MTECTPTPGEVRDSLVYLNKYHARSFGDVDLMLVGSETASQFDRMLAEVVRAVAEKAWADGARAQWEFTQLPGIDLIPDNPYRKKE